MRTSSNYSTLKGIAILVLFITVWCFICECSKTQTGTFEQQNEQTVGYEPSYHMYRTDIREDYQSFLSEFDENLYTITGISNSMHVNVHGSDEFYMVTYRNRKPGDPVLISGQKITVFLTDVESDFFDFLENLTENQNVIDISTSMHLSPYGSDEFYIVTYGE